VASGVANYDIWVAGAGFVGMGTWQMGDANYDGDINFMDYEIWVANAGSVVTIGEFVGGSDVVGVPEPGTLALLAAGLLGLLACAWRRRATG